MFSIEIPYKIMNTEYYQQNICFDECRIDTNRCWIVMRFIVALVLLVAAALKGYDLSIRPILGDGIFHWRWFNIFVVEFEIFFGLWLIFGFLPKLTRWAAIGCFSVFALVSFYNALSGASSCGCMGEFVTINPWIMTLFDCGVVILLLRFCSCTNSVRKIDRFLLVNFIVSWLAIALPLSWGMITYKPALLNTDGNIVGDSSAVILYPQDWIGKRLPLLEYIDAPKDISVGKWTLIFYGADCAKCEKYFVKLKKQNNFQNNSGSNIVCLEIAGLPDNALRHRFDDGTWYWGNLKSVKKWFVETPTLLTIEDGNVNNGHNSTNL
ncbi:MAG: hypothetical protein LBE12_14320 [Planctomycetaceae bacterium]|jgi:hypothetical protein|nr:hypothetical protein [Planctomycetaceae bacterium]